MFSFRTSKAIKPSLDLKSNFSFQRALSISSFSLTQYQHLIRGQIQPQGFYTQTSNQRDSISRRQALQSLKPSRSFLPIKNVQTRHASQSTKSQSRGEIEGERLRQEIASLLGGDDFEFQDLTGLSPMHLRTRAGMEPLKRLVVTALALSPPSSHKRTGGFPLILFRAVEEAVSKRVVTEERAKKGRVFKRATLVDLHAAEEMLHETRLKMIKKEISELSFDQLPDEDFINIPGLKDSKNQDVVISDLHRNAKSLISRISKQWKNEGWMTEYVFPDFPSVSLRDQGLLQALFSLASSTVAEEEDQFSGYSLIVKKAIRRAILERIVNHEMLDRAQKRSPSSLMMEDVKRAEELVEEWKTLNPGEKLR